MLGRRLCHSLDPYRVQHQFTLAGSQHHALGQCLRQPIPIVETPQILQDTQTADFRRQCFAYRGFLKAQNGVMASSKSSVYAQWSVLPDDPRPEGEVLV
jgi:hypothetical protein